MGIEYGKGGTLMELQKKYKKARKQFTDEECAQIMKSILLGIRHLHHNNYVHRDLKPSNIVFAEKQNFESIKLVDFGLAITF